MAKLINIETGKEIKVGDVVITFRGEFAELLSFTSPHKPSSTGRVYIQSFNNESSLARREYFPSVIGAKIINHQFDKG